MQNNFFFLSKSCYENNYIAIDQNKINSILATTDNYKFSLRSRCRKTHLSGFPNFSKFRQNAIMLPLDLLTSRAFDRVARSYERRARSASERKLVVRAGSYHTRPENHENDFEKVYAFVDQRISRKRLQASCFGTDVGRKDREK